MEDVKTLLELNWAEIIIGIIVIIVASRFIWESLSWIIEKLGIKFSWKEKSEKDHKAIEDLTTAVNKISENQDSIMVTIKESNDEIKEIKTDLIELKAESISAKKADQQLTQDRLNQKASYYINELNGIPEDEVDAFKSMYKVYLDRGDGNSGLNTKIEYCLSKLPILPVQHRIN